MGFYAVPVMAFKINSHAVQTPPRRPCLARLLSNSAQVHPEINEMKEIYCYSGYKQDQSKRRVSPAHFEDWRRADNWRKVIRLQV
jgi:hypothetical protein